MANFGTHATKGKKELVQPCVHVPSISFSRKLPAVAEEYSVGIEHGEDDELDVLAKLLGDHVLAGEEFQHTLREESDSNKL